MKVRQTDKWIYIIAVINSLLLIIFFQVNYLDNWDSVSYVNAWDKSLSHGIIDEFRTPIYPIFLGIIKTIFGTNFYLPTIIIQHCIFLISIYYFEQLLSWKIKSRTTVWWLTLFYAIVPSLSTWANCIMTEILAITGVVFFVYCIFAFQRNIKKSHIFWATIWLAFLVFIRPSFLYLIPAAFITWLLFIKKYPRFAILGIFGVMLVSLLELCYCYKFKQLYGVFTPSNVSTINQSWIAFENGLLDPTFTNNTAFKKYIAEHNGTTVDAGTSYMLIEQYGLTTLQDAIHNSQLHKRTEWHNLYISQISKASNYTIFESGAGKITLHNTISFKILYLFLGVYLFFLLKMSIKNKKMYAIPIFLFITSIGNCLLILLGAPNAWDRLLQPSLPIFIIMFGQALNYIKVDINSYKQNIH